MSEYMASHRATRRNLSTQPAQGSRARPKTLRGNLALTPDELLTAMEMARAQRIERDIASYAIRKRTA